MSATEKVQYIGHDGDRGVYCEVIFQVVTERGTSRGVHDMSKKVSLEST